MFFSKINIVIDIIFKFDYLEVVDLWEVSVWVIYYFLFELDI